MSPFLLKNQPKIEYTFLCWLIQSNDTEQHITLRTGDKNEILNNIPLMYLKLTDDNTALFYHYSDPKSIAFRFKFKPYYFPSVNETLCFEAEITNELRLSLEKFDVEIDENESKLYFALLGDGTLGRVLYNTRIYDTRS